MKIIINPSAKKQMSKNLKELRKKSGLSQEGITVKMNLLGSSLERSAYFKIELGVRAIRNYIKNFFKCSPSAPISILFSYIIK